MAVTAKSRCKIQGGLSYRRQENKEEHGDITLGQLDQPGSELSPKSNIPERSTNSRWRG